MKALVLGGNGYLGSKIINNLLGDSDVWCTIKEGEGTNLLDCNKNVHFLSTKIEEIEIAIKRFKFDLLINTVCCYEREGINLSSIIEANLIFPLQVISFAIENGIRKIITIDTSLPESLNLYSLTKKCLSKIGRYYCNKQRDLFFYNVLLENFYGEDEPKNRFLHATIEKLKRNESIDLTEGNQKRDFVYIDDVLQAIDLLIECKDFGFHSVSVGTGEGPTIKEIVSYLKTATHSKSLLNFGTVKSRDNEPDCIANLDWLVSRGYKLKYPYKIGLLRIID